MYTRDQLLEINNKVKLGDLNARILLANARSIVNKIDKIANLIEANNAKIIVINETWLKDSSILDRFLSEFNIFTCNRPKEQGGGVLILVRKSISAVEISKFKFGNIEIEVIDVKLAFKIRIFAVYCPPNVDIQAKREMYNFIEVNLTDKFILLGDFNAPTVNWKNGTAKNEDDKSLVEFICNFKCKQYVTKSTRKGKILDLVISNFEGISDLDVIDGISDHNAVSFSINCSKKLTEEKFDIWDFKRVDFIQLNVEISLYLPTMLLKFFKVDDKVEAFEREVTNILTSNFRSKTILPAKRKQEQSNKIKKLAKLKLKYWKLLKSTGTKENLINFKNSKKRYEQLVRNANNSQIRSLVSKPKEFHRFVQKSFKKRVGIPNLTVKGLSITTDSDKADIFGKIFEESFSNDQSNIIIPALDFNYFGPQLSDLDLNINGVEEVISKLPTRHSKFPKVISNYTIKKCKFGISPILTEIFRVIIDNKTYPKNWKESEIVPIPKGKSSDDPLNYRPIALANPFSRIFEGIMADTILRFLTRRKLIDPNQYGFVTKGSTVLQHISFFEQIYNALYNKDFVDIIFIDIKRAFDSVPLNYLLYKIEKYGISGKLLRLIKSFLEGRLFRVRINEAVSDIFPIKSGVPQGSPLGPVFFMLFINDLPKVINPSIGIKLYADDVKIYNSFKDDENTLDLQNSLNAVIGWCNKWALKVNAQKTFAMWMGKNNGVYRYTINLEEIKGKDIIKDLGISFNSKLKFSSHVIEIVRKAKFKCFQILRTLNCDSPRIWGQVFKTYVRPHLEFDSTSWNCITKKECMKIESVQKFFSRVAWKRKCKRRYLPYKERLVHFELTPLEIRRKVTDLVVFYKLVNNLTIIPREELIAMSQRPSRKHNKQVKINHKNNVSKWSFINRTSMEWNQLDASLVDLGSPKLFRNQLERLLVQEWQNTL